MTVQDAQAPGGQDEQTGTREQDPHDLDCQVSLGAVKPRGDEVDEDWGRKNAEQNDDSNKQSKNRRDGPSHAICLPPVAAGNKRRVDRNEGCGEGAFAKQILEQIGRVKFDSTAEDENTAFLRQL